MKKKTSLILGLAAATLGAFILSSPASAAETVAGISNIAVNATIAPVSTLVTNVRNIADNTPAAGGFAFTGVTSGGPTWTVPAGDTTGSLPGQYVQVSVADNAMAWRLRTYTNNFAANPDPAVWGYQAGGMIGTQPGAKVPMGWLNNPTVIPSGPGVGNPALGTTNGWTYFKDLHDQDDPATLDDPGTPTVVENNESLAGAGGYVNIAYGNPTTTNIVRPNIGGGAETLANPTDPWYFYVEASFAAASADTYTSTVVLELLNQ